MERTGRFQVTIRTLLLVTLLSSIAAVVWINRPTGLVIVRIEEDGSIQLEGVPVKMENLYQRLSSELRWHRIWAMECELKVSATESTPTSLVSGIVDDESLPEFDAISLSVSYSVSVPVPDE